MINSNINKIKYTQYHVPKGYVNTIILNELNLDFSKPITLVEGFFDMINANENCTFLVGSNLSTKSKLFEEIVKNQTDVYLALDPDASKKLDQIAREFLKYDISVFSIDVSPFKDVGEMTRQAFDEKYKEAKQITKNNFLLNKIRALA